MRVHVCVHRDGDPHFSITFLLRSNTLIRSADASLARSVATQVSLLLSSIVGFEKLRLIVEEKKASSSRR